MASKGAKLTQEQAVDLKEFLAGCERNGEGILVAKSELEEILKRLGISNTRVNESGLVLGYSGSAASGTGTTYKVLNEAKLTAIANGQPMEGSTEVARSGP